MSDRDRQTIVAMLRDRGRLLRKLAQVRDLESEEKATLAAAADESDKAAALVERMVAR